LPTPRRINVIGRGPWGQNIVRTLKELGAEVPIIANRETGWRAAFEGNPDGICVAAHPSVNLPVVLECEKRGIPVFIEKPAALNLADVERMAKVCTPIFVNYTHLFRRPDGDPFGVGCAEVMAGLMSGRRHDFGALYDWAPHALALAIEAECADIRNAHHEPLKNALAAFLAGRFGSPDFGLTVRIHRIIDAAEKLNASR
jgi:hypothetical protein